MRRVLVVPLFSALCVLSALCPVRVSAEIIDRVLAILPGQIITLSDVEAAIDLGLVEAPAGATRIPAGLSALIDRVLMLNEVRRVAPPEPSPAAIDARVARIRQRIRRSGSAVARARGQRVGRKGAEAVRRRRSAAGVVSRRAILRGRSADGRRSQAGRRIRPPAPRRRAPPHVDWRLDGGTAAQSGRDGASVAGGRSSVSL